MFAIYTSIIIKNKQAREIGTIYVWDICKTKILKTMRAIYFDSQLQKM